FIDENFQCRITSFIQTDRRSQYLRTLHQGGSHLFLHGQHRARTRMRFIENLGLRAGQAAGCKKSEGKRRGEHSSSKTVRLTNDFNDTTKSESYFSPVTC